MCEGYKVLLKRFAGVGLAVAALWLGLAGSAHAVGNCGSFYTYGLNDTVSSANLNGNITQASTTNSTTACVGAYSATVAEMKLATDPYPAGTESLATSLAGELERVRYVFTKLTGWSQWYAYTDSFARALGTITTDKQVLGGTVTWNAGGTTFTAIKLNVTDTASAAASLLLDLQVGGSSKFSVNKSGTVAALGSLGVGTATPSTRWKIDFGGAGSEAFTSASTGAATGGYLYVRPASIANTSGTGDLWILGAGTSSLNPTGASTTGATAYFDPPTKGGAGSFANLATLYLSGTPAGGANNYTLLAAGTISRFDTAVHFSAQGTAVTNVAASIYAPAGLLSINSGSTAIQFVNNTGASERMRLTDAGILLLGTTVTGGAAAGDQVLANAKYLRGVQAAGVNSSRLIGYDASNRIAIGADGNEILMGAPASSNGAAAGEVILATAKGLRWANAAGNNTAEFIIRNADDNFRMLSGGQLLRIGDSTAPSSQVEVKAQTVGAGALKLDTPAAPTVATLAIQENTADRFLFYPHNAATAAPLTLGAFDTGAGQYGRYVSIGRNTNGTNTGAGALQLQNKAGTFYNLWVDNVGALRYGTSAPTHANDTSGTAVGTGSFTTEFVSSDQTVTMSSTLNVAHGLGAKPKLVQVTLKNATTESNYAVGDEIPISGVLAESNASTQGAIVVFDATNVSVVTGSTLSIRDRTTQGAAGLTAANWKYVIRAWK